MEKIIVNLQSLTEKLKIKLRVKDYFLVIFKYRREKEVHSKPRFDNNLLTEEITIGIIKEGVV